MLNQFHMELSVMDCGEILYTKTSRKGSVKYLRLFSKKVAIKNEISGLFARTMDYEVLKLLLLLLLLIFETVI